MRRFAQLGGNDAIPAETPKTTTGNQWYFAMKAHSGVDDASGLVHHVQCTAANVADVTQVQRLLQGE